MFMSIGQRRTSGVLCHQSLIHSLETGSLTQTGASLEVSKPEGCSYLHLHSIEIIGPAFYMGGRDSNLDPHAYTASTQSLSQLLCLLTDFLKTENNLLPKIACDSLAGREIQGDGNV